MAQVTGPTFIESTIREFHLAEKSAKASPDIGLIFRVLYKQTTKLRYYAYASFVSNQDLSFQMVFITLLCDDHGQCHFLDF